MGTLFRDGRRLRQNLPWLGLALVAALSLPPLLFERPEVQPIAPYSSVALARLSTGLVLAAMLGAIVVAALATRSDDAWALRLVLPLALLAALMAAWHWYWLDRVPWIAAWQREMYFDILNGRRDAPHLFRPLPHGFARSLEHVTGDWLFACLAYRWFFTYWFVWGCYRLARLWLSPALALLTLVPVAALYPLSVWFYLGQLTDPLSHALFVFACLWTIQDRTALLAVSLALGILAKETAVLLVPVYWACHWPGGVRLLLKTALMGAVCVAAFLAVRLPYGWYPGYGAINGTDRLMIFDNLGIGEPTYAGAAPLWQNYLQPALFVLPFVPLIAWGWRRLDARLKAMCLTLPPLLLLSNLCFGWLYESRNYMPLLPVLGTAAAMALRRGAEPSGLARGHGFPFSEENSYHQP
jgi:hypothetical protein